MPRAADARGEVQKQEKSGEASFVCHAPVLITPEVYLGSDKISAFFFFSLLIVTVDLGSSQNECFDTEHLATSASNDLTVCQQEHLDSMECAKHSK